MRLSTPALQVDVFPVGTGKRFVQRVVWNPGAETEMKSFRTVTKTEALYDINSRIANGAEVVDFNTDEYQGSDYSPLFC